MSTICIIMALKCYRRERKDGSKYTTCEDKKQHKKAKAPAKAKATAEPKPKAKPKPRMKPKTKPNLPWQASGSGGIGSEKSEERNKKSWRLAAP